MNLSPEFGKALPDQVTSEQLRQAHVVIARLIEVDPDSVQEGTALAERLQGVSRAVSNIVLTHGAVEITDLKLSSEFNPDIMPAVAAGNILRSFENRATRLGRMFIAQPSRGYGASMGVHEVTNAGQNATHDVIIPTDQSIDRLLSQEPCLWDEMGIYSRDFRGSRPNITYPFNNRFHNEGAAAAYFGVVQELSAELLTVTQS